MDFRRWHGCLRNWAMQAGCLHRKGAQVLTVSRPEQGPLSCGGREPRWAVGAIKMPRERFLAPPVHLSGCLYTLVSVACTASPPLAPYHKARPCPRGRPGLRPSNALAMNRHCRAILMPLRHRPLFRTSYKSSYTSPANGIGVCGLSERSRECRLGCGAASGLKSCGWSSEPVLLLGVQNHKNIDPAPLLSPADLRSPSPALVWPVTRSCCRTTVLSPPVTFSRILVVQRPADLSR